MTMLLMNKGENSIHRMWIEHHYLALAGDVFREFDPVKKIHENARPGDIKPATFDKMIEYIDEHYQQKLELEDIARIGGYNVAYTSTEYRKQVKEIRRKTMVQNSKEIISVENQDVLDLLQSFLSYEDDARAKAELEYMSHKLESLKAKLADVVSEL